MLSMITECHNSHKQSPLTSSVCMPFVVYAIVHLYAVVGNIYSHMRKHTGQMYRCRTCDFKTVNKSHLLEHESTHSGTVHICALCHKHYSTNKSLINHVRIYHSKTEEGKLYHQKFVQVKEGKLY